MADINTQLANDRQKVTSRRTFIFKDGIKGQVMRHTSDKVYAFQILPAMDPQNTDRSTSWAPFRLPDGSFSQFAAIIYASRFVGHQGGNQFDALSPTTFDDKAYCPVTELYFTAMKDKKTWGYLVEKTKEDEQAQKGSRGFSAPLTKPHLFSIMNIKEVGTDNVRAAAFGVSLHKSLFGETGLLNGLNRAYVPGTDYMGQWACGDITNPFKSPALEIIKVERNQLAVRMRPEDAPPLSTKNLADRVVIPDLVSYLEVPTIEQIIDKLIWAFNKWSPSGIHEYALLKLAFPNYRIPAIPSAPAASPTIQAGFSSVPAANVPPPNTFAQAPQVIQGQALVGTDVPSQHFAQPPQAQLVQNLTIPGPAPTPQQMQTAINQLQNLTPQMPAQQQVIPQGIPQQIPQGIPQQIPQGIPQQVPQAIPQQILQSVQQQLPQGFAAAQPQGFMPPQGIPVRNDAAPAVAAAQAAGAAATQTGTVPNNYPGQVQPTEILAKLQQYMTK